MKILNCILLGVVCAATLSANPSFRSYTPREGLSHRTVLLSVQDKEGVMWFGTEDGLNSFDGYNFKVYRHRDNDKTSLPGDRIASIEVCSDGTLWVSVGKKIVRYNRESDTFESWEHPTLGRQIRNIFEIRPGKIGISYATQMWCFDTSEGSFGTSEIPSELVNSTIICCSNTPKAVALGSEDGRIFIWDKTSGEVRTVGGMPEGIRPKSLLLGANELWVGTEGSGLLKAELKTGLVSDYREERNEICSNHVRALCYDNSSRLWIGTYKGLDILDHGKFTHFSHDSSDKGSLSDNSIRTITRDSQGGMWLGTFYGGINYWHPGYDHFAPVKTEGYSFSPEGTMQAMAEAPDRSIWMGADYQTVVRYDPSTGKARPYRIDAGVPLNIKDIHFDGRKVYLASHLAGLTVLDIPTGRYRVFRGGEISDNISCILPKDNNNVYLGTSEGLCIFNKQNSTVVRVPSPLSNPTTTSIIRNSDGSIWAGGNGGIAIYKEQGGDISPVGVKGKLRKIRKVKRLFLSSEGDVYICADRLCRYSPADSSLVYFSVDDGLPTNIVNDIVEDELNRMWLFTANGLCCYNPSTGTFKQYRDDGGMAYSNLGSSSMCKSSSGQVYIGTQDGVISFNPVLVEDNPFNPAPVISNVFQSGKAIKGDVVVPYDGNTLSFEFNTYNYLSGGEDLFSFRLKGYDKEWRSQRGQNTVTYYNIPPGRYVFEVRAANNDGIWNPVTASRPVRVKPFFAYTPLAIVIYALLALLIICGAFYIRLQRQEQKHSEEVHELKVNFFINFLNEMKTPLTLINSPLQEMIPRAESNWMRSQLRYVEKNSRRLIHLVSQMLLFRKAQLDVISLKVRSFDADRMIGEIVGTFARFTRQRGVQCSYSSGIEGKSILADPQYLEIILNNLLSNAVKFTSEGAITVRSAICSDSLNIQVEDSGCGMSEDYHRGPGHLGTGLGLAIVEQLLEHHHGSLSVESEKGKGSVFTVCIPQNRDAYKSEEFSTEEGYDYRPAEEPDCEDYDTEPEIEVYSDALNSTGRILLVISDKDMQKYLNEGLSRNFEVMLCSSEAEAMSMGLSNEIDAVLVYDSKDIDGLRLCVKIKEEDRLSHIPVVILSSRDGADEQLKAFRAGASDFFTKPFSLAVLTVKIGNIISERRKNSMSVSGAPDSDESKVYSDPDERFLERVNAAIMRRIDDIDLSINDIVKEIGMSRSSFFLKLKALTGLAPQDYVRKIRFRQACQLLLEGDRPIAEIAAMTGFNSASYFSRAFKKYYGILPSNYKSSNENQ